MRHNSKFEGHAKWKPEPKYLRVLFGFSKIVELHKLIFNTKAGKLKTKGKNDNLSCTQKIRTLLLKVKWFETVGVGTILTFHSYF